MKRLFQVILIGLFFNSFCLCQEDMKWDAKFALGGGFTPGWIFPNLDEINKMLPSFGVKEFSNSGFFTTGGLGHISIAVVKNIRVGMMGFGGSIVNESVVNSINKEAMYSASVLGFTAEYTIPFISYVAISAGVVIGGGKTSLELFQNADNYDWSDVWDNSFPIGKEYRKISNTFFTLTPTLNFEYPVNRFLALRLGGGYILALSENWKYNNDQEIKNLPSRLTSNALFLNAGILIGYFNY